MRQFATSVRVALAALALTGSAFAGSAIAADVDLKTDDEKTLYVLGVALSRNLSTFGLTEKELVLVQQGLADGVLGKEPKADPNTFQPKIQALARDRQKKAADAEKEKAKPFLEGEAKKPGAVKSESGVIYTETQAGTGEQPAKSDRVKVHYHGTLPDGTVFDSSKERGQPVTFPLSGVIPCWTEGVQKMKVGGKAHLVCPSDTAYGDRGAPPKIKPGSALVFDVELLEIVKTPPAPPHGMPGAAHGGAGAAEGADDKGADDAKGGDAKQAE